MLFSKLEYLFKLEYAWLGNFIAKKIDISLELFVY